MPLALDYAAPRLPRSPMWRLGAATSWVGAGSSAAIVWWSIDLAERAQFALIVPTDCGTGRHDAEGNLLFVVPFALTVPLCAWLVSRFAGAGQLVCRCSVWSAILGWMMSIAFAAFR